jgi:hypothetical protein
MAVSHTGTCAKYVTSMERAFEAAIERHDVFERELVREAVDGRRHNEHRRAFFMSSATPLTAPICVRLPPSRRRARPLHAPGFCAAPSTWSTATMALSEDRRLRRAVARIFGCSDPVRGFHGDVERRHAREGDARQRRDLDLVVAPVLPQIDLAPLIRRLEAGRVRCAVCSFVSSWRASPSKLNDSAMLRERRVVERDAGAARLELARRRPDPRSMPSTRFRSART